MISITDLININNAAKALKQKVFIIKNNKLYGLDNINNYLVYCNTINNEYIINCIDLQDKIIETRALSAFIKEITTEDYFELKPELVSNMMVSHYYISTDTGIHLQIKPASVIDNKVLESKYYLEKIYYTEKDDITDQLSNLFSMKVADGIMRYIYNNKYYMTLFPGLLPLNKADKVLLQIHDNSNSFISKFSVIKKKYIVTVYLAFLKV